MIINILLLVLGFVLLIKGADIFVDGASSTALNFKVSKMLIGLTIVAFGTSAPEFAVSINALASGRADMVLGNVVGSCVLNILLIIGIAAVIRPITIKKNTIKKELPLVMILSVALGVVLIDTKLGNGDINQFTRSDAIIILLFFIIFLYYLVMTALKKDNNDNDKPKYKIGVSLLLTLLGLIGIIFGSDLVVDNASSIAKYLGLSERIIAITIIAFGTSLPELVTAIVAAKKDEQELLLGNIIGSNIFNICIVLGVPVAIFGTITLSNFQSIDIIMIVGTSILLYILSSTKKTITRIEGVLMLLLFAVYYTFIFIV